MHTCTEKIDLEALRMIVSNSYYLYNKGLLTQHDQRNMYREITDYNTIKTLLYRFLDSHTDDGDSEVVYQPVKTNPDGRLFSTKPSVQGISRRVRHTICRKTMVDVDVKNAHPTFLLRLCKKHDLPHSQLEHYINNRDQVIQGLIAHKTVANREDGKTIILKVINGGSSLNWEWNEWLYSFFLEMKTIRARIRMLYPKQYKLAVMTKGKGAYNLDGTCLNYVLCDMERIVLNLMIAYCKKHDLPIGALCHDGLMLLKEEGKDYNTIANELTEEVGLDVVVKPMDEYIELDGLTMGEMDSPIKQYDKEFLWKVRNVHLDCWTAYTIVPLLLEADRTLTDRYKYAKGKKANDGLWYELQYDNRWTGTQEPLTLRTYIAETIYSLFTKLMTVVRDELKKAEARDHTEKVKNLKGELGLLKKNRETWLGGGFRSALMTELKSHFLDNEFGDTIDQHEHLIGFYNGVYDLATKTFRNIQPSDYLQKSTGWNYSMTYSKTKMEFLISSLKTMFVLPYAKKQSQIAEGIVPDEWVDDPVGETNFMFFMKVLASCLFGGNKYRKLYILIGSGSNGKSVVVTPIGKVFGRYKESLDISALTKKKTGANDTSDLPKTRGARMVICNESDQGDSLQTGLVKTLTGNDPITCRELFQNNITFVPQYKIFILTNHTPKVGKMDEAMASRIQLISFPFKFFDCEDDPLFDPNEKNKTHFLGRDTDLADKLCDCHVELFHFLLEIYNTSVRDAKYLEVPTGHQEATTEFLLEQNTLKKFLDETYTAVTDIKYGTGSDDLRKAYNNFSKENLNQVQFPQAMRRLGHEAEEGVGKKKVYLLIRQ